MHFNAVQYPRQLLVERLNAFSSAFFQTRVRNRKLGYIPRVENSTHSPQKDDIIVGLENITDDIKVFHSGTSIKDNKLYTSGGRVLCVVAQDSTIELTQQKVYNAIKEINYKGMQYRHDIASSAINLK